MTQSKAKFFLIQKGKRFPEESLYMLKAKLNCMDDDDFPILSCLEFTNPNNSLVVSLLFGSLGIDRFMVGDVGLGILKLLTGGLCGIMTLIDWIRIRKITRKKNLEKFIEFFQIF